jgi:hypothetical protein
MIHRTFASIAAFLCISVLLVIPPGCGGGGGTDPGGGSDPGGGGGGGGGGGNDPPAGPAFSGYDLTLEQGDFWKFGWDYYHQYGGQGSSTTTYDVGAHLYARLGAPVTIAAKQAFPVEYYGPTKSPDGHVMRPRWRWLASSGNALLGSTDGVTLQTIYDMETGSWPGGGFFSSFPSSTLVQATAATLSNDWVTASGVVIERSSSQDQCEYFPGVGTICGDSSYTYSEKDYFQAGVGPLGYWYHNGYSDCGGGYCSFGTWDANVGLVASSFGGATFTPVVEAEPNNSRGAAQVVSGRVLVGDVLSTDAYTATSVAVPDAVTVPIHDFLAFDHAGGNVELTLSFESVTGADLDLYLFNGSGSLLAYSVSDNAASGDLHEQLTGPLAAGRYYVGVSGYTTPSRAAYQLLWE